MESNESKEDKEEFISQTVISSSSEEICYKINHNNQNNQNNQDNQDNQNNQNIQINQNNHNQNPQLKSSDCILPLIKKWEPQQQPKRQSNRQRLLNSIIKSQEINKKEKSKKYKLSNKYNNISRNNKNKKINNNNTNNNNTINKKNKKVINNLDPTNNISGISNIVKNQQEETLSEISNDIKFINQLTMNPSQTNLEIIKEKDEDGSGEEKINEEEQKEKDNKKEEEEYIDFNEDMNASLTF